MPVLINSKYLLLRILPDEPEDLPIPCLAHLSVLVEALYTFEADHQHDLREGEVSQHKPVLYKIGHILNKWRFLKVAEL